MKTTFKVNGMKCGSCVAKITEALKNRGLPEALVSLNPPEIQFRTGSTVDPREVQAAIASVGDYSIQEGSAPQRPTLVAPPAESSADSLVPLGIILSYLVGGVLIIAYRSGNYRLESLMMNLMGGFFVLFSLFKMINLEGFAEAYATYDVVAKRSRVYALAYPFIELFLGIGYLLRIWPSLLNTITVVIMGIGTIGVYQALRTNRRFQCACLGTALKLPMTKVTLVEDLAMGMMALVMLWSGQS